jgi:hypothetical protein
MVSSTEEIYRVNSRIVIRVGDNSMYVKVSWLNTTTTTKPISNKGIPGAVFGVIIAMGHGMSSPLLWSEYVVGSLLVLGG